MADWNKIKTEYITTDTSYRKLAEKHGVGESTLFTRASKEKWVEQKEQHQSKTVAKTLDAVLLQVCFDRNETALQFHLLHTM